MLDRAKLAKELERVSDELFIDFSANYAIAKTAWQELCEDPLFFEKVAAVEDPPWPVPGWNNNCSLDTIIPVAPVAQNYTVISTDGSQIYPDRHQGVSCFLINIGSVILSYSKEYRPVFMRSVPYVFTGYEYTQEVEASPEFVNCKRHELELKDGLALAKQIRDSVSQEELCLLLVDGSLIFWHLEGKGLKDRFLDIYLLLLLQFQQIAQPMVGYISAPKSKELVNLVRLWLCDFDIEQSHKYEPVNALVDATIVQFFLPEQCRTIVFENKSKISTAYPAAIHPYFFYVNVGTEIGRVELPAWIAHNTELVDRIASVILDQSLKGRGYPVIIAEAHEQAVVKGPDRELFYHLLRKIGMEHCQRIRTSIKSQSKLRMGI